jgi:hypothetical protein
MAVVDGDFAEITDLAAGERVWQIWLERA